MICVVSDSLRKYSLIPLLFLASTLVAVVYWGIDRDPPLTYIGHPIVALADAGVVRLSFRVERHRYCDVTTTRWIVGPNGFRFDFLPREFSAAEIEELEKRGPGQVRVALPIPPGIRSGNLIYGVKLEYNCDPVSRYFPIIVRYDVPFTVQEIEQ